MAKSVIPQLKGNPKYKDAPRYELIYEYEGRMKRDYHECLKAMGLMLGVQMKKQLNIK